MAWRYYKCNQCPEYHFEPKDVDTSSFISHLRDSHDITYIDLEDYEVKHICPLTFNYINKMRSKFWKYVDDNNLDLCSIDYECINNIDGSKINLENKEKIFDVDSLNHLYEHYFSNRITSKKKIEDLTGIIRGKLLIILVKIYKKELTIEEALIEADTSDKSLLNETLLYGFMKYPRYANYSIDELHDLCKSISNELDILVNSYDSVNNALLTSLDKTSITTIDDKSVHAEVSSPIELLHIMINHVSDEYLLTKRPTFLDYSCGKGNIVLVIFVKYYNVLKQTELSDIEICKLICESYLYIADINPINVYITQVKLHLLCKLITGSSITYSYNMYIGDSFKLDLSSTWNIDKVDIVFVNPPFEDKVNRSSTQHKLWIDFTLKTFSNWLSNDGYLYQISPSSFVSPSSKIFKLFKQKQVDIINLEQEKYFPTVNSSISWYIIQNKDTTTNTTIINNKTELLINDSLLYLPNDFNVISLSIHQKVMFATEQKLDVKYDYVTCHNNILLKSQRNKTHSTISKTKTDTHIYPIFHTNKQIWYSEIKQDFADKQKIIWTRSGYTKPFYDNGTYGVTDLSYYVLVDSEEEGKQLESILTSKLFAYIFKTARWSGFGNDKVFYALPKLPKKKYTDKELHTYFKLTDQEITYMA